MTQQHDIIAFRTAARQPIRTEPKLDLSFEERQLAFDLIAEELLEFGVALRLLDPETKQPMYAHDTVPDVDELPDVDIVECADALADLLVVTRQGGPTLGLDLDALWKEVHRSNMSKVNPETGYMDKNERGKAIKPPTYFDPDLEPIIAAGVQDDTIEPPDAEAGDIIVAPSVALAQGSIPIAHPELAQLSVITIPLAHHVTGRFTRNVYVMAGMKHEPKWPNLQQILRHNQEISDSNGKFIDLNV